MRNHFAKFGALAILAAVAFAGPLIGQDDSAFQPVITTGATYYVSPTGSNSNAGTEASPWATPGYGAGRLKAGDTLVIKYGTYKLGAATDVIKPVSGKKGKLVTIQGQPSAGGKRPILAGSNNLQTAIDLSGLKYVTILGLEITHDKTATGQGIYFNDGIDIAGGKLAQNITLQDLYIHHVDGYGVQLQDGKSINLENCNIEYCGSGAIGGPAGTKGGWQGVTIETSRCAYSGHYYRGGSGSGRPVQDPKGCGILASKGPVEISGSTFEHNYGDAIESFAPNTSIHECTIANNTGNGLRFWVDNARATNCLIYGMGDKVNNANAAIMVEGVKSGNPRIYLTNVTVDDNAGHDNAFCAEFQRYTNGQVTVYATNCIFAGGKGAVCFYNTVTAHIDHCLFNRLGGGLQLEYKGRGWKADEIESGGVGPGCLSRDPLYKKKSWGGVGDYHLAANSACIDAGTPTGAPDIDLAGTDRPQGGGFDMGAYEQ